MCGACTPGYAWVGQNLLTCLTCTCNVLKVVKYYRVLSTALQTLQPAAAMLDPGTLGSPRSPDHVPSFVQMRRVGASLACTRRIWDGSGTEMNGACAVLAQSAHGLAQSAHGVCGVREKAPTAGKSKILYPLRFYIARRAMTHETPGLHS